MTTRIRWTSALWIALGLLASTTAAAPAFAQGVPALPAYGEPTIISGPRPAQVFGADFTSDGIPDIARVRGRPGHRVSRLWVTARSVPA